MFRVFNIALQAGRHVYQPHLGVVTILETTGIGYRGFQETAQFLPLGFVGGLSQRWCRQGQAEQGGQQGAHGLQFCSCLWRKPMMSSLGTS